MRLYDYPHCPFYHVGNVVLYQLSYTRIFGETETIARSRPEANPEIIGSQGPGSRAIGLHFCEMVTVDGVYPPLQSYPQPSFWQLLCAIRQITIK